MFVAAIVAEASLFSLLAMTFSRGGMLGAGAIMMGRLVQIYALPKREKMLELRFYLFRLVGWCACAGAVGVTGRFSTEFIQKDDSALNRITLWKGSVWLLGCEPWTGWKGISPGVLYSNCIQDRGDSLSYHTLLNPFLECFVQFGVPLGAIVLGSVIIVSWAGLKFSLIHAQDRSLGASAGLSWISWVITNQFSYFVDEWTLWIVPSFCLLVIGLVILKYGIHFARDCVKAGVAASCLIAGALAVYAISEARRLPYVYSTAGVANLKIGRRSTASDLGHHILFLPEAGSFGGAPGRYVRELLDRDRSIHDVTVAFGHVDGDAVKSSCATIVIATGWRVCETRFFGSSVRALYLVFPKFQARCEVPAQAVILLPEIDERRMNWIIESWYANKCRLITLEGTGYDIRAAWRPITELILTDAQNGL